MVERPSRSFFLFSARSIARGAARGRARINDEWSARRQAELFWCFRLNVSEDSIFSARVALAANSVPKNARRSAPRGPKVLRERMLS